ncbi:Mg2+/Co2+ transporter [Desulfitobacterium dichloroeliminans LMG P-21439]|uniref:Mg2+/Co2+ transporter n=1 Tax=Desulfitobacterium dichloroeliminans (strain LMG P-21439 / DCA1) TaxID=871963 RepID=L0FB10_DESDL|nr:magnesium transporter CorA family protein [Desulfitobacterium dichloroeliminans]AGA69846.1 Mg2+/Co2+ transporter [Desulfitobacterium dichloroeliminans LMG P-21439]
MLKICKNDAGNYQELTLDALVKGSWIQMVNPTPGELNAVAEATEVPLDFLKAALDEEERSRIELEDHCILIITNIPLMINETNYDTLPLGMIITEDHIITVSLEDNPVFNEFNADSYRSFNTGKRTRFLFQILYKSASYYLKYLRQINKRTDQIELDLRTSMKNQEIFQLMDLQKGLTFFTVSLRSNGVVMDRLLRLRSNSQCQHLIKMYEEDEDLLEDVIIENNQAIQMVEMYTNILGSLTDAFASIISNNLNMVMKFLASMTIILAVPTMLASFWGMNVVVPFRDNPFGFSFVLGIAFAIAGVSAFILWKKKMF